MAQSKKTGKTLPTLRTAAEKRLKAKKSSPAILSAFEAEHELNVHKIELEMQNEELLLTQSKLLRSIEDYTELFEYAPVGYFILNERGIVIRSNRMGVKMLGAQSHSLTGKPFMRFLNGQSQQDNFYRFHQHLLEGRTEKHQGEFELKKTNGLLLPVLIESSLMMGSSSRSGFVFTAVSDITIQKENQHVLELSLIKEKELNDLKSRFITIASHEFRTPLATILSSAELLERFIDLTDADRSKAHVKKIKSAVNRLREIMIDFLSASEIDANGIANDPKKTDIQAFIAKTLAELKSFNGIHNTSHKHTGRVRFARVDKRLLKTCLSNVIINAYKYSPRGGQIAIHSGQLKNGNMFISVTDHGIGIPLKDQANIFKSFFRAYNTMNIEGTGLGLNITRKLLSAIGGKIYFTSEEQKGSTFTIEFPRK